MLRWSCWESDQARSSSRDDDHRHVVALGQAPFVRSFAQADLIGGGGGVGGFFFQTSMREKDQHGLEFRTVLV
jgi:hypothetical protein